MYDAASSSPNGTQTTGAIWYYLGGILSLFVGFAAIGSPYYFSGMIALLIGAFALVSGMLLAKFPSDAEWAVGLLFGINSVFLGFSLIMFAAALPKAQDA